MPTPEWQKGPTGFSELDSDQHTRQQRLAAQRRDAHEQVQPAVSRVEATAQATPSAAQVWEAVNRMGYDINAMQGRYQAGDAEATDIYRQAFHEVQREAGLM
ncbi:MAG TPA: hypothetical protein VFG51_02375 [Candidatus Saccharimonadia bacterium]|nr:hypothetical protein [Candidatus Saccharimonadia bacterium]